MLAVEIMVSDPWDWVTEHGPGPFRGKALATTEDSVLVQLDDRIDFGGNMNEFVIASARHSGDSFAKLKRGQRTPCDLRPMPADAIQPGEPESMMAQAVAFAEASRRGFLLGALSVPW